LEAQEREALLDRVRTPALAQQYPVSLFICLLRRVHYYQGVTMEFEVVREGSGFELYRVEAANREEAIELVENGGLEPYLFDLTTVELTYISGEE
jgi:hypothetical protein